MSDAKKKEDKADNVWDSVDLEVEHAGTKIILPDDPNRMSIDAGIKTLTRIKKAEETVYQVAEEIPCHFFDGLVCFAKALKNIYGYSQAKPTPGFFGETPPRFVHVKTGPNVNDFIQVPYGSFSLPNIDGTIQTIQTETRGIPTLAIVGKIKAKDKKIVMDIIKEAVRIQKAESIYAGRSIILESDQTETGVDFDDPLEFFDPSAGHEVPIHNKETEDTINVSVMAPLIYTAACRAQNIPLKRGILLEGPYGTGKTLTAKAIARVANEYAWTFILVKKAQALKFALRFAAMYQPCVVFTEDIDSVVEDRNQGANDLINEIDGVVGKNAEIMTILTTNFASKIDKAMLRPGRLDTIISLRPPEGDTVARLIEFYAGDALEKDTDLSKPIEMLSGTIPANIAEVVKKSKLAMLFNGHDKITGDDIAMSAQSMKNHLELLERASEGRKQIDPLSEALAKAIEPVVKAASKKAIEDGLEDHFG